MSQSSHNESLSVVLPVRDQADGIAERVIGLMKQLLELKIQDAEVIIVDDGSRDETYNQLQPLHEALPQLRIIRHNRPRGMEAAGQSGLERATGQIVLIHEGSQPARSEDLKKLLQIAKDRSVVAARAESTPRPPSQPLLRRLRAWGTDGDQQIERDDSDSHFSSVQMLRRSNLKTLAGPKGPQYRLASETSRETVLE